VFEELAQADASQSVQSLVGQAISELHLGRLPESQSAFEQAVALSPKNPDVLANLIVLNTVLGKATAEEKKTLQSISPGHQLVKDLADKRSEFDKAASRYAPRVNS
jgi:coatomer subunit epsilon